MSVVLIGVLGILILTGVPLAFAMGIASLATILHSETLPLSLVAQRALLGADSYSLLAIPFFILAGNLMNRGGLTDRIIAFANALVGRFTGGLGLGNVAASMIFAGVSGSAVADTTALGSVLIPAMKKQGYDGKFSAAITAASSVCGPIIPPSIPLVLYGLMAGSGVSIGALFLGGVVPGLFLGFALLGAAWIIAKRRGYPKYDSVGLVEFLRVTLGAVWALIMPLIILGGVVGGVFTVTESAAIAVLYATAVGFAVYRELKLSDIPAILIETALASAMVMIIVAMANIFGWLMAASGLPKDIADGLLAVSSDPLVILLIINVILLIVGTFMEAIAALVLLVPVLVPVVTAVGIDLVHFGVVMVFNLMLGLLTPPVGICVYIAAQFAQERVETVFREVMPLFLVGVGVLVAISVFPDLVLALPRAFQ